MMKAEIIRDENWAYERLKYTFGHHDYCLSGLCKDGDKFCGCFLASEWGEPNSDYLIIYVDLDDECKEYLEDYEKFYHHWCWKDGERDFPWDGRDLKPFGEKWGGRNPIFEKCGIPKGQNYPIDLK